MTKTTDTRHIVADLAKGVVAGLVATKLMGQVTNFLWEREDQAARKQHEQVTGGDYPPDRAAELVEKAFRLRLSQKQHGMLAQALHMGLGLDLLALPHLLKIHGFLP